MRNLQREKLPTSGVYENYFPSGNKLTPDGGTERIIFLYGFGGSTVFSGIICIV